MENKYLKSLEEKISKDRIIMKKDGRYVCKFCKDHPDDCYCDADSELRLEGYNKGFKDGSKNNIRKPKQKRGKKNV